MVFGCGAWMRAFCDRANIYGSGECCFVSLGHFDVWNRESRALSGSKPCLSLCKNCFNPNGASAELMHLVAQKMRHLFSDSVAWFRSLNCRCHQIHIAAKVADELKPRRRRGKFYHEPPRSFQSSLRSRRFNQHFLFH